MGKMSKPPIKKARQMRTKTRAGQIRTEDCKESVDVLPENSWPRDVFTVTRSELSPTSKKFSGYKHDAFTELLDEIKEHHNQRGAQYATTEHPFQNFDNVGMMLSQLYKDGLPCDVYRMLALLGFVGKQVDSVVSILSNPDKLKDSRLLDVLEEHSQDVAVYFLILVLMVREYRKELHE